MNRSEWRSAYRTARLDRRRDMGFGPVGPEPAFASVHRPGARRSAAWAFAVAALLAAAVAFWRVAPMEQRSQTLAVSVPAASTPAAAESPSSAPS